MVQSVLPLLSEQRSAGSSHSHQQRTPTVSVHRARHSIHAVISTNSTASVLDPLAGHLAATDIFPIFSTVSIWLLAVALAGNSEHTTSNATQFANPLCSWQLDQFVVSFWGPDTEIRFNWNFDENRRKIN